MNNRKTNYEHLASTVLKNIKKRNFTGSYAPTAEEAREQICALLKPGMTVAQGGSETLAALGFRELTEKAGCTYLDRGAAQTPQERREYYAKSTLADVYFMSSNAVTVDGELVNIDGSGNRVACLIHGPEKVVLVIGMNKVARDLDTALARVKMEAAPPNCVRLKLNTPCSVTGVCADCHSEGCICCNTVITRHNRVPGRIHLILVGEDLGY
jgi:L-lactate utilization protein LutB